MKSIITMNLGVLFKMIKRATVLMNDIIMAERSIDPYLNLHYFCEDIEYFVDDIMYLPGVTYI